MRIQGWLSSMALAMGTACGSGNGQGDGSGSTQSDACPGEKFPATFEAESAQLQGVQVASDVKGFSGTGYVTGFDHAGTQVAFQVCAPRQGYYTLDFAYAKGTDGAATRTLLVDGTAYPGQPVFPPLWTWNTWDTDGRRAIHLDAGNHTVAVAFRDKDTGDIRLDKMVMTAGPGPTQASVRSLFMNNWKDLLVSFHAAKLYPADDKGFGPRLTALHWSKDWPVNQIDEAQAFFRDETGQTAYADTNQFDTTAFFTASDEDGYGDLRVQYGAYGGKALPVSIAKRMSVPPGEEFVVVAYDIGNLSDAPRQLSVLEWAHLHNKTAQNEDQVPIPDSGGSGGDGSGTMNASWDAARSAWIADMSQTNGTFIVMGSFDPVDHHVAGPPVVGGPDSRATTVQRFAAQPSSLTDSESFSATNVGIGTSKTVMVAPTQHAEIAWFYGVADSLQGARALADHVRQGGSAQAWMTNSSNQWKRWLASGKGATLDTVPQWAQALRIALITNRQAQQPEFGSFVASTNPAYEYKVWVRDASVAAMFFDAAGYLDDAERFWSWMSQVQADGSNPDVPNGSWWTNYSFFAKNTTIHFVEPELDSIGLYVIGVYRHYLALKARDSAHASQFLTSVWPVVQKAANFMHGEVTKPENFDFGAKDFSIWEEIPEYVVFTQTTYASGLRAAQLIAQERQDAPDAQVWGQDSGTIATALYRDTSIEPCPGPWNAARSYFIRAIKPDCSLDDRIDSSSDLLWVFGLLDAKDSRASSHRRVVLENLTPGKFGFGISRYQGDQFYHSTPFDPGHSHDAQASMPVWPQMSMYMSLLEHWVGMDETAASRLSWYVATTNAGYQPPGEAVDWTTELPIVSTASEPVTGAWYGLALLNYLGAFDPRLPR